MTPRTLDDHVAALDPLVEFTHIAPDYAASFYRGVLLIHDRDADDRLERLVDAMADDDRDQLALAGDRAGGLVLRWVDAVPGGWREGDAIDVDGLRWVIVESRGI